MTLTDVIAYDDFIFAYGTFLDKFKNSSEKATMIEHPPAIKDANKEHLCVLAAAAHKLANDNHLPVPRWVNDPIYKMPHPIFAFDTKRESFRKLLMETTPYEFASRNIFCGADATSRA